MYERFPFQLQSFMIMKSDIWDSPGLRFRKIKLTGPDVSKAVLAGPVGPSCQGEVGIWTSLRMGQLPSWSVSQMCVANWAGIMEIGCDGFRVPWRPWEGLPGPLNGLWRFLAVLGRWGSLGAPGGPLGGAWAP